MRARTPRPRRWIVAAAVCLVLFCLTVVLAFVRYRERLDREFNSLVAQNLTAYAESQQREVEANISDVSGTLEAIATLAGTQALGDPEQWLPGYLEVLSQGQSRYSVTYLSVAQLTENLKEPGVLASDWEVYDRLAAGETVVSEVRLSQRLGQRHYFSIAIPVVRGGEVVGVLRSLMEGELLIRTLQTGYLRQSINSCLVKGDGAVILANDGAAIGSGNLYTQLPGRGVTQGQLDQLRAAMASGRSATIPVQLDGRIDGFLSITSLGYNDWHILNFAQASDVAGYAQAILHETIAVAVMLVLCTAAAGLFFFWLLRRQERVLEREQRRYAMLANFSDTVLFEYDLREDTLSFTSNAANLLPLRELRVDQVQSRLGSTILMHPDDRWRLIELMEHMPSSGGPVVEELRLRGVDGEYFWCQCQYQVVFDERRHTPSMLIGKLMDIDAQKQKEQGLIEKSQIDALTGLENKSAIETHIAQRLQEADFAGYLMMIDIDDFKRLNDQYGHMMGDQVLARIGQVIRLTFRETDLVGRVGGDEFMALIRTQNGPAAVAKKAQALMAEIAALAMPPAGELGISCSIGVAAFPQNGRDYASLYRAADQAMYQAKKRGKNGYSFH